MTGPAVVSVARIEPDLARRSWARVRRLVARDDPGGASDDLRGRTLFGVMRSSRIWASVTLTPVS